MKKILAFILTLVMCVGALTACGSSESAQVEESISTSSTTLTCGINQDIDNFNPYTNQQIPFVNVVNFNCYECLFHYNEDM